MNEVVDTASHLYKVEFPKERLKEKMVRTVPSSLRFVSIHFSHKSIFIIGKDVRFNGREIALYYYSLESFRFPLIIFGETNKKYYESCRTVLQRNYAPLLLLREVITIVPLCYLYIFVREFQTIVGFFFVPTEYQIGK